MKYRHLKYQFNWLLLVVLVIAIAVVIVGIVFLFNYLGEEKTDIATKSQATVSETSTASQATASQQSTEGSTAAIDQPDNLVYLLNVNQSDFTFFDQQNCSQIVTVVAQGNSATVQFYEKNNGVWTEDTTLYCSGFVGQEGVVDNMSEDICGTPAGIYPIGQAFYIDSQPDTKLESFNVTQDTYWIDDPDSQYYNQRVEGTANMDWDSAEHMIDYYDQYKYGFVINYNMPAQYNAGSAIFFHIGNGPTAGCVAVDEQFVLKYLSLLDSSENPYIIIA